MDLYRHLKECISQNVGAVILTITEIRNNDSEVCKNNLIGFKLLYIAEGEYFVGNTELSDDLKVNLLQIAEQALLEGISKTYVKKVTDDDKRHSFELEIYTEVYPPPPHLIVAGAGHVAKPVVQLGKMIGFYVTVICDRKKYANRNEFPWADEVVCKPYIDYFKDLKVNKNTFILLLTRGHQYDVMILREMLGKGMGYLGMIGSRRRISGVFSQLALEFPDANFDNIYAPVGLDLGEETPEEIAVSITAEILKVKNNHSGSSLRDRIKYFIRSKEGRSRRKRKEVMKN